MGLGNTKQVSDLKVNPNNPRKITDGKRRQLGRSMDEFGDISGVWFNVRSGNLGGGNQRSKEFDENSKVVITKRYATATEKGTVAVGYILHKGERFAYREVDWDEPREVAAGIAANKNAGVFDKDALTSQLKHLSSFDVDFDLGLTMFDDEELADFGIATHTVSEHERTNPTTGVDEDEVPEKAPARTKPGCIYQLGEHRLMCGDSTIKVDVETLMAGEKAQLFLTDPPYGVGMQAREESSSSSSWVNKDRVNSQITNDEKTLEEMKIFWKAAAECALTVCNDKAAYYWFACQGGDQMMMMMMMLGEAGWQVKHELIWVKDQMCFGRADYHYKHEPIIYGWKRKRTHEWYGDRTQTSTFEIPRPKKSDLHPTMKPIELLERLLINSSGDQHIVLDLFLGSGSTLIACEKTNRRCFGMEIDPHYCDIIVSRWEKYTGKTAKLLTPAVKLKKKKS